MSQRLYPAGRHRPVSTAVFGSSAALCLMVLVGQPAAAAQSTAAAAPTATSKPDALPPAGQTPTQAAGEVQAQPEAAAGDASALSADIVVTARKREEAARDVPIAISAFGTRQLDALHVRDVRDLATSIPNVRFDSTASPGVANFTIRGLGVNSSIPTIDPTVGTFIDGIYVGTSYGVVLDTFDLAAIEVLRGPQGLLFGRNVTGGAVVLRSRRPVVGGPLQVRAKASYETGEHSTLAASVDVPLGAGAAAKVTGYYSNDHGFFRNDLTGKRIGAQELYFVRPTLVVQPTANLDATLILEHGEATGDGVVLQNGRVQTGFHINVDQPGSLDLRWNQATFETNLQTEFGNGTITNLFGYRDVRHIALGDFDGLPQNLFHAIFALDQRQYSDELRYHGKFFDDRLDFTTGLYFFNQHILYRERRFIRAAIDRSFGGDEQETTLGAFASADYEVVPKLTVTVGARYSSVRKDAQVATFTAGPQNCDSLDLGFRTRTCRYNFIDGKTFSGLTPKVGLTWKPNDDLLFYASATRGYRSGGYNVRNTSTPQSSGPTKDETQDAYEIGAKTTLFGGGLRLNGDVFLTSIDNLQRETNVADPVVGVVQAFRNTANGRIAGIEFDGVISLSSRFSINFAGGYQDGKYTKVLIDLNGDQLIDQTDLDLNLPRLAKLSATIGGNLDIPLGAAGILSARAQYSHLDGSAFTDSNSTFLRGAELVDGSVKFATSDRRYSLSIYGKNLLDEVYESSHAPTPFGTFRSLNKGRVIGVEFGVQL